MKINVDKFGTTLISRPSGKEAFFAFQPTLEGIKKNEEVIVDFAGVQVLTPSWADEFLTPLYNKFGNRIKIINVDNPSVTESLKILKLK